MSAAAFDPAHAARLCELASAAVASGSRDRILAPLVGEGGHTTSNGSSRAPHNLGHVVLFQLTYKSTSPGLLVMLQFSGSMGPARLCARYFEPDTQASTHRWSQKPDTLVCKNDVTVKDFMPIQAGRMSNARVQLAVFVDAGQVLDWRFLAHNRPSDLELLVSEVVDVRAFHAEYTRSLHRANAYRGAIELFQTHHTANYASYLQMLHQQRSAELAPLKGRFDLNESLLFELQRQLEEVNDSAVVARTGEESTQRAAATQRRYAALADARAALEAQLLAEQQVQVAQHVAALRDAHTAQQTGAEALASEQHEVALRELRADFARREAEVKTEQERIRQATADARAEGDALRGSYEGQLQHMRSAVAKEAQERRTQAKNEILVALDEYTQRRQREAETVDAEAAKVDADRKLFDTFRVSYVMQEGAAE